MKSMESTEILSLLRKGDQVRIADMVGTVPEYVKHILRYRPNANSRKAIQIREAATRVAQERKELMERKAGHLRTEQRDEAVVTDKELEEAEDKGGQLASELDLCQRECEDLRRIRAELMDEVEQLQQTARKDKEKYDELSRWSRGLEKDVSACVNRYSRAESRAEELEADNARLRRAILEQATCFAATLKALMPEA